MKEKKYRYVHIIAEKEMDIISCEYTKKIKVDLEIAKESVSNRLEFTDNQPHYTIIDISNVSDVSAEAKEYMQSPDGGLKNILGAAFIAPNPVAKLMAEIYIKTNTSFEARLFSTKEEGLQWLLKCIENKQNDNVV